MGDIGTHSRLVSARIRSHSMGVEKKSLRRLRAAAEKLKAIPHLDEAERLLYARSLLATPEERWRMHETYLRSLNLFSYFERKKSASWSWE
jgi:hypothetical protein